MIIFQVMRIIENVQPNRQTVMFSATFPRQVEAMAKKILNKPVEIMVMYYILQFWHYVWYLHDSFVKIHINI